LGVLVLGGPGDGDGDGDGDGAEAAGPCACGMAIGLVARGDRTVAVRVGVSDSTQGAA